jgi:hypothetical protein
LGVLGGVAAKGNGVEKDLSPETGSFRDTEIILNEVAYSRRMLEQCMDHQWGNLTET